MIKLHYTPQTPVGHGSTLTHTHPKKVIATVCLFSVGSILLLFFSDVLGQLRGSRPRECSCAGGSHTCCQLSAADYTHQGLRVWLSSSQRQILESKLISTAVDYHWCCESNFTDLGLPLTFVFWCFTRNPERSVFFTELSHGGEQVFFVFFTSSHLSVHLLWTFALWDSAMCLEMNNSTVWGD